MQLKRTQNAPRTHAQGELLLQGVHDAVPVTLLKNKQAE